MALKAGGKGPDTSERLAKDRWDKIDIIVKALIPVVVALSVWVWNDEKASRDTAAQMITIATSILTAPPENSTPSALRQWAIDVLRSPQNPPTLTEEAAIALATESIPFSIDWVNDWPKWKEISPTYPKSPLEPSPYSLPSP